MRKLAAFLFSFVRPHYRVEGTIERDNNRFDYGDTVYGGVPNESLRPLNIIAMIRMAWWRCNLPKKASAAQIDEYRRGFKQFEEYELAGIENEIVLAREPMPINLRDKYKKD